MASKYLSTKLTLKASCLLGKLKKKVISDYIIVTELHLIYTPKFSLHWFCGSTGAMTLITRSSHDQVSRVTNVTLTGSVALGSVSDWRHFSNAPRRSTCAACVAESLLLIFLGRIRFAIIQFWNGNPESDCFGCLTNALTRSVQLFSE